MFFAKVYSAQNVLLDYECGWIILAHMTNQSLIKKISDLESDLRKLKLEVYLKMPKNQKLKLKYPDRILQNTIKSTRNTIWQKNYAKKI